VAHAITWASTARIAIEVWNSPGHHIAEAALVKSVTEKLLLKVRQEEPPLSKENVLLDIDWAIEKGYLNRYGSEIRADQRLSFELEYLVAIAAHCIKSEGDDTT
jgi:hypothetical protein